MENDVSSLYTRKTVVLAAMLLHLVLSHCIDCFSRPNHKREKNAHRTITAHVQAQVRQGFARWVSSLRLVEQSICDRSVILEDKSAMRL